LVHETEPDIVIHAAAMTDVDMCEINASLANEVNMTGTSNVVEALEDHPAHLIYVSTDYVFSGDKGFYCEEDEPNPINIYGSTKYKGEKIVSSSALRWTIVRPSLIFDSGPAARKSNFAYWVINMIRGGEPLEIINDQWSSPILNSNLANMIMEVAERRMEGIYHFGGLTPINRYAYAVLLADTFNLNGNMIRPIKSETLGWYAKRPLNSSLDVSKARRELSEKPLSIFEAVNRLKKDMHNRR
jgi:dTDP-4-dehydrorhamnose reductase